MSAPIHTYDNVWKRFGVFSSFQHLFLSRLQEISEAREQAFCIKVLRVIASINTPICEFPIFSTKVKKIHVLKLGTSRMWHGTVL